MKLPSKKIVREFAKLAKSTPEEVEKFVSEYEQAKNQYYETKKLEERVLRLEQKVESLVMITLLTNEKDKLKGQ